MYNIDNILVCILLSALLKNVWLFSCHGYTNLITINDTGTHDCIAFSPTHAECPTLDAAFSLPNLNDTCILLEPAQNTLNKSFTLQDVYHFSIIGSKKFRSNYEVNCALGVHCKLTLIRCQNVTISGFEIRDIATYYGIGPVPGLFIINSRGVSISHLFVSPGSMSIIFNGTGIIENNNNVTIFDVKFYKNSKDCDNNSNDAITPIGKGAALFISFLQLAHDNSINIMRNTFVGNVGCYGAAVYVYFAQNTQRNRISIQGIFKRNRAIFSGGALYVADFGRYRNSNRVDVTDSFFRGNIADLLYGGGAIYCYNCYLSLNGHNQFFMNRGSAIVLGASSMKVNGNLIFTKNFAKYGGAMYLYKCSNIITDVFSNVTFIENHAGLDGGALYVLHQFKKKSTKCFFHPQSRVAMKGSINFHYNRAGSYGNHIYTSTLALCPHLRFNNKSSEKIFFHPFKSGSINTAPNSLFIQQEEWNNHPPGLFFKSTVKVYDERHNPHRLSIQIQYNQSIDKVHFRNTYVISKDDSVSIALYGQPNVPYVVFFYVNSELGILARDVKIKLSSCPSHYNFKEGKCQCSVTTYDTKCYNKQLYVLPNIWLHRQKSYTCPRGYCGRCEDKIREYCRYDPNNVCDKNRTQDSRLCSKCKGNMSAILGTDQCMDCSQTKLSHTLWLSILYCLSIIILVILFALLNYRNFAWYFIPVVIFYQIVPYLLEGKIRKFNSFIFTMFNSNSRFTNGYCFLAKLDNLSKLWIELFTALTWVFSYAVLFAVFKSKANAMYAILRSWPIIFTIYYIDSMKFSLRALHPVTINDVTYVYKYADEEYFGSRHTAMFGCALLILCCTLVTLYLIWRKVKQQNPDTDDEQMEYITDSKRIKWFLFFYVTYLTSFLTTAEMYTQSDKMSLLLLITAVYTGILSYRKPYSKLIYNLFEVVIYIDMLLLGVYTICIDDVNEAEEFVPSMVEVLVSFPFCSLLILMIHSLVFTICHWRQQRIQTSIRRASSLFPARALESDVTI